MLGTRRKATEAEIRLRTAKAVDRARLIALINAAYAVETFIDGPRTNDKRLAAVMRKGSILVAEDKGARLVAAVYVELRGARGYLGMLAVEPRLQGKGLGRRMTFAAEQWLLKRGCKITELTVLNLRRELLPFYRKCMVRRATAREKRGREDKSAQMYSAFSGDQFSWPG